MMIKSRNRKHLRRIAILPSLVTLMNGVFGFAAIHFTARGMNQPDMLWLKNPELTFFEAAGWMIFFAMLADCLDGWIARMSRSSTNFGAQLDSLADVISFGVAPAFLMLRVVENSLHEFGPASPVFTSLPGRLLWLLAALYICCTALRLARFNVETTTDETSHMEFRGLPSPAAAGVVASLVLLYCMLTTDLKIGFWAKAVIYALPIVTLGVALLMVSSVRYPHMVNQYLKGRRSFAHLVKIVLAVAVLFWKPQLTLAVSFMAFASSGLIRKAWLYHTSKQMGGLEVPGGEIPPESGVKKV